MRCVASKLKSSKTFEKWNRSKIAADNLVLRNLVLLNLVLRSIFCTFAVAFFPVLTCSFQLWDFYNEHWSTTGWRCCSPKKSWNSSFRCTAV